MYHDIEYSDWNYIRRKNKKHKKKYINIEASHNEYDTYYLENDYEKGELYSS